MRQVFELTKVSTSAYCEQGLSLLFANGQWEKPCCTEQLPETSIFGYPFWKEEYDADVSVRITINEHSTGLTVGRIGALRYDSASLAEQWADKDRKFREDDKIHPFKILGKKISRNPFPGAVECNIEIEMFDGCNNAT